MVYLDHNATTPLDLSVRAAMLLYLDKFWGNPSSGDHKFGWDAADAIAKAREDVAALVHAKPYEIIFTSGATESINAGVKASVRARGRAAKHILTSQAEHDAMLQACEHTARTRNIEVVHTQIDKDGYPLLDAAVDEPRVSGASMIALMLANNEIGTVSPIKHVAALCRTTEALLMCDITQAVGKMPVDVRAMGIDLAAFSAHKVYGPKGVGALYIRGGEPSIELEPLIVGGGQERGLRGGTLNVPGIVGFGEACRIAAAEMHEDIPRMQRLRDKLEKTLLSELPDTWVNGDPVHRICNTSNMGFKGVDARALIRDMHDIAVSTRSACSSGDSGPSHVLKAIGLSDEDAYSCIRFSVGRFTTDAEIDYAIEKVTTSVKKLRRLENCLMDR